MAEILGVVAAATQPAATCIGLLDLTRKLKGGSSTLRDYQRQLQELHNLSEAISCNPLLQTPEVGVYTCSLLTVIHENDLKPLIERGRFLRSWTFISKDRELSEVFAALERQKTSLSLLIHNIQAQAIHQIQSNVQDMANSLCSDLEFPVDSHIEPQNTTPRSLTTAMVSQDSDMTNTPTTDDNQTSLVVFRKTDGDATGRHGPHPSTPRTTEEEFDRVLKMRDKVLERHPKAGFSYNCVARYGGTQHNSVLVTGDEEVQPMVNTLLQGPPDVYMDCYSMGGAIQSNAPRVFHTGGVEIDMSQREKDFYVNCDSLHGPSPGGIVSAGVQYNDIQIHKMKGKKEKGRKGTGREKGGKGEKGV